MRINYVYKTITLRIIINVLTFNQTIKIKNIHNSNKV